MKKLLSLCLATAMSMSMVMSAAANYTRSDLEVSNPSNMNFTSDTAPNKGAAPSLEPNGAGIVEDGSGHEKDITIKINKSTGETTHVIALNVDVTSVEFTYHNQNKIWDPVTLDYKNSDSEAEGWSNAETVIITNYSDVAMNLVAQVKLNTEISNHFSATLEKNTLAATAPKGTPDHTTLTIKPESGAPKTSTLGYKVTITATKTQ